MGRPSAPLRIVQWNTGNVGREAVAAVVARPDLELVGVFARDPSKVGCDAAQLCGLSEPTGVLATQDADMLLGLEPDCVVYSALHLDVEEVARILGAGVNVVTTSEFLTGAAAGGEATAALGAAALAGGATLFGTGINPGYAQLVAAVCTGISRDLRTVAITESVDVTWFAADPNFESVGWGRPRGDEGHAAAVQEATAVFADALEVLAALLGRELDGCRCTVELAHATERLEVPGMIIEEDHVAGIDVLWEGLVEGEPRVSTRQRWVIGDRIAPPWSVELGYVIEIGGDPNLVVKVDLWPSGDLESMGMDDFRALGSRITAVPVVSAIPRVCAAEPGIRTYADLPVVAASLR
jgi:hypothetical protein